MHIALRIRRLETEDTIIAVVRMRLECHITNNQPFQTSNRVTSATPYGLLSTLITFRVIATETENEPARSELLLQKQYRPPIDKVVVEVPAGLIDAGESPETCALRELKEETGYIGEVLDGGFAVSPIMYNGECRSPFPAFERARKRLNVFL